MQMAIRLIHYSDLLCVWAYVAEARLRQVRVRFGEEVEIEHRFCSVFGDCAAKVGIGWQDRGGYDGFAAHVREVVEATDDVKVHPDLWVKTRPASSESAHLVVKACQLLEARGDVDAGAGEALASALRQAFFGDARDIARWHVQVDVVESLDIPVSSIEAELRSGAAYAALACDAQGRDELDVRGSSTLLLNEGRQRLYGNVGYRVIEANIQELLREPSSGQASWC